MTRRLYRVNEVADICGLGKTKTYSLINRGLIRSVRIDGGDGASRHAIRVPATAVEEYVALLEAEASGAPVS